jgi:hypothetical protein
LYRYDAGDSSEAAEWNAPIFTKAIACVSKMAQKARSQKLSMIYRRWHRSKKKRICAHTAEKCLSSKRNGCGYGTGCRITSRHTGYDFAGDWFSLGH